MKKSAEHSRSRRSIGKGKRGKGWRSHRRGPVPADCIRSATTATADHARPGTVSGPAADHRRTATTTGTEGQRTGSGPGSRRLSSGCTSAAWSVVAFATKKGGNCCPNCLLWQQFRHLQQVFALSETRPATPPPLQWHQLTTAPAGWGVVYRPEHRIGAESLHNSSPFSHVLTPVSFSPDIGGRFRKPEAKNEKVKKGSKKIFIKTLRLCGEYVLRLRGAGGAQAVGR